jgi:uncharacterized metal-binding protein YceD (DUF177 family)
MALPTIHLRDIPESGLDLEPLVDASWLREVLAGTDFEPFSDPAGKLRIRLDKSAASADVILNVRGSARVRGTCVRCLEPIDIEVSCTTSLLLEPATVSSTHKHGEERELTAEELDRDVYSEDKIELSHWVREQILVELPAHPTHEDCVAPKSPGVERTSGDPRWAALEKFKTKKEL